MTMTVADVQARVMGEGLWVRAIAPGAEPCAWVMVEVQMDAAHSALLVQDMGQECLTARVHWKTLVHALRGDRALLVDLR